VEKQDLKITTSEELQRILKTAIVGNIARATSLGYAPSRAERIRSNERATLILGIGLDETVAIDHKWARIVEILERTVKKGKLRINQDETREKQRKCKCAQLSDKINESNEELQERLGKLQTRALECLLVPTLEKGRKLDGPTAKKVQLNIPIPEDLKLNETERVAAVNWIEPNQNGTEAKNPTAAANLIETLFDPVFVSMEAICQIGKLLKLTRQLLDIDNCELAKRIGVSTYIVSRLESGTCWGLGASSAAAIKDFVKATFVG